VRKHPPTAMARLRLHPDRPQAVSPGVEATLPSSGRVVKGMEHAKPPHPTCPCRPLHPHQGQRSTTCRVGCFDLDCLQRLRRVELHWPCRSC
jgi:hypothetical protein